MTPTDVKDELTNGGAFRFPLFKLLLFLLRFLSPVAILLVLLYSLGWMG